MNLISITCSASPSRGYSYDEADEMIDLFDAVLDGRATEKTLDRMVGIVTSAQPVTASMRKGMKAVRLPGDKARKGLAEVTDSYWVLISAEN